MCLHKISKTGFNFEMALQCIPGETTHGGFGLCEQVVHFLIKFHS